MTIYVCVGSSCHLKGSYDVILLLKNAIETRHLEDKVEFKAAFCLGKCTEKGITIKVDEEIITGLTKENFDEMFAQHVLAKL